MGTFITNGKIRRICADVLVGYTGRPGDPEISSCYYATRMGRWLLLGGSTSVRRFEF